MNRVGSTAQAVRFGLWAVVGAGACLAFLTGFTIGFFVAPVVGALALVLLLAAPTDRSLVGAVSGLSIPLFYVAWLNRDGPGLVCRVTGDITECRDQWSPWPWLLLGLALLTAGVVAFRRSGRPRLT